MRAAKWLLSVVGTGVVAGQTPSGAEIYRRVCAVCHEQTTLDRIPSRATIAQMSPENVLAALTGGVMRSQASNLTIAERRTVAMFITGNYFGAESTATSTSTCKIDPGNFSDPLSGSVWNGWGVDNSNSRYQPNPGFTVSDVPRLKVKWAYALPGAVSISTQPVIAGGRLFLGGRTVVSLDARTGCTWWEFKPEGPVRAAVTIAKPDGAGRWLAFVADGATNAYALDSLTGALQWKAKADDTPVSRVTGAPKFHDNRLFVPISSLEDGPAQNPSYECCKFSGAIVALNAVTGKILWTSRTVREPAHLAGQKEGHKVWGPPGASVWDSPTIDPKRNAIYAGMGNNHSNPPTATSDSVLSFNMETGALQGSAQMTKGGDAWNMGCGSGNPNCPENPGPDHDVGNSPILVTLKNGKHALVFGQKSGVVHAVHPDDNGKLLWEKRIGHGGALGGVEWGGTSDGETFYVPLSDVRMNVAGGSRRPVPTEGGGLFAFDIATGRQLWAKPPEPCPSGRDHCSPAQSQAAASMPGAVFSGSVSGIMRAYSATDGSILW